MIEFTEGDRERVTLIARRLNILTMGAALDDAEFLRKLAERPAGDAGLREWLRSEETKLRVTQAVNTGVFHELDPAILGNVIGIVLAALADSTEGGERS